MNYEVSWEMQSKGHPWRKGDGEGRERQRERHKETEAEKKRHRETELFQLRISEATQREQDLKWALESSRKIIPL